MTSINADLLKILKDIAARQNLSVEDLLRSWVMEHERQGMVPVRALELALDGVISVNEAQEIIFFNQGAETIFCYTSEEVLGKRLDMLIPDDMVPIHRVHMEEFGASKVDSKLMANRLANVKGRRKDGSVFPLEASISKVEWQNQRIFTAIVRDVSQQQTLERQLREERDLIGKVMNASPAAITVMDVRGKIIFANVRAAEIYGVSQGEITRKTFKDLQWQYTDFDGNPLPEDQQPFAQVMKTRQPVYNVRHAIEWSSGKKVYLNINGVPMFDEQGEISKVVFSTEDISFQKQIEDELKAALAKERHLSEIRSLFLSTVSHEFRNPMTLILTNTGYLRLRLDHLNQDDILTRLNNIDRQVNRLSAIVDEVSFISRSQTGQITLTPKRINPVEYLRKTTAEIGAINADKNIEFTLEPKGKVATSIMVDEYLLDRIYTNVLGNAVKYSAQGGQVVVCYECTAEAFELEIQDFGRGIPHEDQEHLFEVFYRGTNVEGITGTGLGLVVAQKAVETHRGTISFESIEGQGTTFAITLPYLD